MAFNRYMNKITQSFVNRIKISLTYEKYSLAFILVLSIILRVINLGSIPDSLQNDEVANTYGTRFILENGQDIYGNPYPILYLDKFGDYPPVLPMYLSGLGTYIFGPNEFGSRILIALTGALLVLPVYYLGKLLFQSQKGGIISAFLVAILPGHIVISRYNAEAVVALTVFISFLAITAREITKEKVNYKKIILGCFLGLSTYLLYPGYRIITPLVIAGLTALSISLRKERLVTFILGTMFFCALFLTFGISTTSWGKGRFEQTSILSDVSGITQKIQVLVFNEESILEARIFNNKVIGYGRGLFTEYSKYFSLDYLFGESGRPQMYNVPFTGILYIALIPLILASCTSAVQMKNRQVSKQLIVFMLYVLLISPLPAALTVTDVPNIQRSALTPIIITFVATYGAIGLLSIGKFGRYILLASTVILVSEIIIFSHQYTKNFSYYTSAYRNDGNKQLVQYLMNNHDKYEKVLVSGEEAWISAYYLFYSHNYDKNLIGTFEKNFRAPRVNNIFFTDDTCPSTDYLSSKKEEYISTLIIDSNDCIQYNETDNQELRKIDTIKQQNEMVIFTIYKASQII